MSDLLSWDSVKESVQNLKAQFIAKPTKARTPIAPANTHSSTIDGLGDDWLTITPGRKQHDEERPKTPSDGPRKDNQESSEGEVSEDDEEDRDAVIYKPKGVERPDKCELANPHVKDERDDLQTNQCSSANEESS